VTSIVALVGVDGAGKTTQAQRLAHWLTEQGRPADYWQNAGGRRWFGRLAGRLGRRDADQLVGPRGMLVIEGVLRWLSIARALLFSRLRGQIAVMDRYACCQYASIRAHHGRGEWLARRFFGLFPEPDVTFYMAVPVTQAYRRVQTRATDSEELADLAAADAAYRSLPEADRFVLIDAGGPPDDVQRALRRAVEGAMPALATNR
jgi:dTMP kinase